MEPNQKPDEGVLTPELQKMFDESSKALAGLIDAPEPSGTEEKPKIEEPVKEPEEKPDIKIEEPTSDDIDDDGEEKPLKEQPARPTKYIPIHEFKEFKNATKQREQELLATIEDLKQKKGETKEENNDRLETFAEKYDMPLEQVKDLVELFKGESGIDMDAIKEAQKQVTLAKEMEKDQEFFEQEYNVIALPILKEKFPNATDSQLLEAKKVLDEKAHSDEYFSTRMDHIVKLELDSLKEVFNTNPSPERIIPKTTTSEKAKSTSQPTTVSAKDIVSPKDFYKLTGLSAEKKDEILRDMNPVLYLDYTRWEQNNSDIQITRIKKV